MKSNRPAILIVLLSVFVSACLCTGLGSSLPSGTTQPSGNLPSNSGTQQPSGNLPGNSGTQQPSGNPAGNSETNPPSGSQPGSSGIITTVVMAQGVQGAANDPVNPTTVFSPSSRIHAVIKIKDAPANTKFAAAWYVVDVGSAEPSGTLIDSTEVTSDGTRNIDFYLTPNSTWPVGQYRVDISVNGHVDQVMYYTVQ